MNCRIKISACRINFRANNTVNILINKGLQIESTNMTVSVCRINAGSMQHKEGVT